MNCSLCNAYIASGEVAIAADWLPGFWDGNVWCDPCCRRCATGNVAYEEGSGEYVRVEKGKAVR